MSMHTGKFLAINPGQPNTIYIPPAYLKLHSFVKGTE